MLNIDFWYGNTIEDVDEMTSSFSDIDCEYRGNYISKGQYIGDYTTDSMQDLQLYILGLN